MRAEYDHDNNRVVTIEMDDGRLVGTHNPRILGARTELVPVVVHYPEGYDERFHQLLKPNSVRYEYNDEENFVEVHYPEADYSPEAIRNAIRISINNEAKNALQETDWYVVRQMETGKAIPAEILELRDHLRHLVDVRMVELENTPDEELTSFQNNITGDRPNKTQAKPIESVKGGDGRKWITDATDPDERGNPLIPSADQDGPVYDQPNPVTGPVVNKPGTGLPWEL